MIKSQYTDPALNSGGFWNHVHHFVFDAGVYPGTTNVLIELYKIDLVQSPYAASGKAGKPRNIALFYKPIPIGSNMLGGTWRLLKMWQEGVDYQDSSAAGSVAVHPHTGNVHVQLSFGMHDAHGNVVFQEYEEQIQRSTFAAPIERLQG